MSAYLLCTSIFKELLLLANISQTAFLSCTIMMKKPWSLSMEPDSISRTSLNVKNHYIPFLNLSLDPRHSSLCRTKAFSRITNFNSKKTTLLLWKRNVQLFAMGKSYRYTIFLDVCKMVLSIQTTRIPYPLHNQNNS